LIRHIYIYSLPLLAILLLPGCGKRKAPDFDGRESELVLAACEAIVQERDQDAMNALNELRQYTDSASFVEEAQLATRRHSNARQINSMLETSDLKKLKQFLLQAEKDGILSSDMLLNSDVPDALQALMLFCAKMPWEDSDSLQRALVILTPYVETLSATESFRAFHASQLELLKKLQREELLAKVNDCLKTLDKAAATGNRRDWVQAHNELHKLQPESQFFKYEMQLGKADGRPDEQDAYAIALLGNWERLNAAQRKTALEALDGQPSNLCGRILQAMRSATSEALRLHLEEMSKLGLPASKDALMFFIGGLNIVRADEKAQAGRTNLPCLGLKGIFDLCSSITITQTTGR